MNPLIASFSFYAYVFLTCEASRQAAAISLRRNSLVFRVLLEFLGTLQLATCIFEGSIVAKYSGNVVFSLVLFGIIWIHVTLKRDQVEANPSPLIENWLLSKNDFQTKTFVALLFAELAGGYLSFRMAQLFWGLEFSADHGSRFKDRVCQSDLKASTKL